MQSTRIKISSIVESQLPGFVRAEYPLVEQLLKEYYSSLDSKGLPYDILSNIDQYVKVDNIADSIESTTLTSSINFDDDNITVSSTTGFPKTYGLIKIDNEIILYKSKTDTTFIECSRGFSGITKYSSSNVEDLEFSKNNSNSHTAGASVENLSTLFLKQFFGKLKKQFLPGFEGRELYEGVKESTFVKQSKDFYNSKGTSQSFEILFRCLYGEDVTVVLPKDNLIKPSESTYEITRNFVVSAVQGDPEDLANQTIFQDQYETLRKSFGTVSNVEKIIRGGEVYYNLQVDSTINNPYQNLKIHSKTHTITTSPIDSDKITVDSTLSFEDSGDIIISFDNQNYIVSYTNKTINQFLNCTGITTEIPDGAEVTINSYAYGFSRSGDEIRFRFNGVISKANLIDGSLYYNKNNIGRLLSLGYNGIDSLENNWIINNSVKCAVKSSTSLGGNRYSIETFDNHNIYSELSEGQTSSRSLTEVEYVTALGTNKVETLDASIDISSPAKKIIVTTSQEAKSFRFIKRKIDTIDLDGSESVAEGYMSDVLNVYKDFNTDDVYVTSSSLPSYYINSNEVQNFKFDLDGDFPEDSVGIGSTTNLKIVFGNENEHGLITGDLIVYKSNNPEPQLGISTGGYFVNRVSPTNINIARSRSDLFSKKYISIATTSISNEYFQLQTFDKDISEFDSQRLIRKFSKPKNSIKEFKTLPGTTGLLLNGVEVLNYKSNDFIYYGSLERIDITSTNSGLDIINPPILGISSATSSSNNAKGTCGVEGSLSRIDIIDPGFDYTDTPIITISGGSGTGAKASAQLVEYDYSVSFDASFTNTNINLNLNQIGFSNFHRFRTGEYVVYETFNATELGGLTNNSKYYVRVIDDYKITLHITEDDAFSSSNTINLTSFGQGSHSFRSTVRKKKLSSVTVFDSGSGYKNKEIKAEYTGINTANNTINVFQHPYQSGEIIFYYGGDSNISGLDTGKYIVTRVNDKSFKLSPTGVGTVSEYFYYNTNQYVNLESQGSGLHEFNYEKITVSINGPLGTASSLPGNEAEIQPIFRGDLVSISLSDGGVGYGSSEIINFNKQPDFTLTAGSGAAVTPIISNGRIVDVIVYQKGSGYNSPPDIKISGSGIGAVLTPIVRNGVLDEVKIVNSGINYNKKDTLIEIVSPIGKFKLTSYPKSRNINTYKRLSTLDKFASDDNVVYRGRNSKFGLQFTHLYVPKKLRSLLYGSNLENNLFRKDIDNDNSNISIKYHSPIIGWAYDGNPIYGPYGFDSITNKTVRKIKSSYKLTENLSNRPSQTTYELGYFIEDYVYDTTIGDLDRNNGRFCVTPEFPQGVYAYFATLDENNNPSFPYIIGDSYHSDVIDFNLSANSTQEKFDFENNLVRNTNLYNSLSSNSNYEYFLNISKINLQNSIVNTSSSGNIDSLKIISPGQDYKVGDKILFNSDTTPTSTAIAEISKVSGKEITQISNSVITIEDVELYPSSDKKRFVAFSTSPHNLQKNDIISIDSLNRESLKFESTFKVDVDTLNELILSTGVGDTSVTGIVTYFNVIGNLNYSKIRENDILSIDSEKVKVLNIDEFSSRIRVLRDQESTVSSAHSSYTKLIESPRKFFIDLPKNITNEKFNLNREIYFNPSESLGIGTLESTLTFTNPGIGITSITIPDRSIFIENHNLNSGDLVIYKPNSGDSISVSTDGLTNPFDLPENIDLYVVKFNDDLIGISSNKIGLSNDGNYIGIGTTAELLYFNGTGTKDYHSFSTKYENSLIGDVNLYKSTVSTATTHSLKVGDNIILDAKPKITKTFVVKYDDFNKRLVIDPKDFTDIDIDVENDLISIEDHGYSDGDKVIHTSIDPVGGLNDEQMYYISAFNKNNVRLFNSYYDSINKINQVGLTSQFSGTLSRINPKLDVIRNNKVVFDLSDSSLSEKETGSQGISVSAFDFKLYIDDNFTDELISISSNSQVQILGSSNIVYTGNIGIDNNAKVEFTVNSLLNDRIYYDLVPIGNNSLKKSIVRDDDVKNNNEILFVNSSLSGKKQIVDVTANTFDFFNSDQDFVDLYLKSNGDFSYITDSRTEFGAINQTRLISRGFGYKTLPYVSNIKTSSGSGALLVPQSKNIGSIESVKIKDIGYDYSSDPTLKPLLKFSTKYRVEPLTNIEYIKVLTPGFNYITNPDILLIDSFTKEVIDDLLLDYQIGNEFVDIIQNTKGIYNVTPSAVVYNNSNGVGISSILYDNVSKIVKLSLKSTFSSLDQFPFELGDEIFVEGINVTEDLGTTVKGYNSEDYNYESFKVIELDASIGGSGAFVKYSLSEYLTESQVPGTWDSKKTGSVVNTKYFPTFEIKLAKNKFEVNEKVTNGKTEGTVDSWEENNEFLTVELDVDFNVGDLVFGKTTSSQAFIKEIFRYESFYEVDSSSVINQGWQDEIGFLSSQDQRIQDSNYYQNFSYVLESRVQLETWKNDVNNLNHTLGFKKFATYIFDSDIDNVGLQTSQDNGAFDSTVMLTKVVDFECIHDFDLVSENFFYVNNTLNSDEIIFNSTILLDYAQSIGNRALIIDDISNDFNSQISQTFVTSFNI